MSDDEEIKKLRREDAIREHERILKGADNLLHASMPFAQAALRAPGLAGATGVGAMLAFITANRGASPEALDAMGTVILGFGGAVLASAVASGAAYLAQLSFARAAAQIKRRWEHPYYEWTSGTKKWNWIGGAIRAVAVVLILSSYVAIGKAIYDLSNIPAELSTIQLEVGAD